MAIKELITLEGAQEVKKTLADLGKSGEDFVKKVNAAGGSNAPQLQQLANTMRQGVSANREHARSVNVVSDAYHLLHPILRTAGFEVNNLRSFAVLAHGGLLGLGVAIAGSVLIALQRLADNAAVVKQRLSDMVGPNLGSQLAGQFRQAETSANALGGSMAQAAETILRAVRATSSFKGITQDANGEWSVSFGRVKDLGIVTETWSKQIQLGGKNADDAAKSVNKIADAIFKITRTPSKQSILDFSQGEAQWKEIDTQIEKTAGLTAEAFDTIENESPALATAIAKAFNFASVDDFRRSLLLMPRSADDVLKATEKMADSTIAAFQNVDKATQTMGQNLTTIKNIISNAADEKPTGINKILGVIAGSLEEISKNRHAVDDVQRLDEILGQGAQDAKSFDDRWGDLSAQLANTSRVDTMADKFERLARAIREAGSAAGQFNFGGGGGGGGGEIPPFATGGLFRGRGGIDTNLAWLTDLEYILRPAAVRKYGTKIFDWFNSLQIPVGAIPGFAEGGLNTISNSMVTITGGGNNQRPFVLNLPGFGSFRGSIAAPDQVVDALSRASAFEQLAQGGRPPGWRR